MSELCLRPPGPSDEPAIVAMFERCSSESRYARFHNPARHLPSSHLRQVLDGDPASSSLVAIVGDEVVGLATCYRTVGVGEVGILVEDAWQRRGVGTELLWALVCDAQRRGVHTINAFVLSDRTHVLRWLARIGPHITRLDRETTEIQILLGAAARSEVYTSQAEVNRSTASSRVDSGSANESRMPC